MCCLYYAWFCLTCILQLPTCVLSEILNEVVLQEGDKAYYRLALVCTTFRDTVPTDSFRRRAHFQWIDSKCFNKGCRGIQYLSTSRVFSLTLWKYSLLVDNLFSTGVATWSRFSESYRKEFLTMYTVDTCRECGMLFKNCTPGKPLNTGCIWICHYTQYWCHNYTETTSWV